METKAVKEVEATNSGLEEYGEKWLTYEDVERIYRIPRSTLYALVGQRRLPFHRIGPRFIRFEAKSLREFFDSKKVPASGGER